MCIGADDPLIPPEQRASRGGDAAGGVDWRMNPYGGAAHSFTNERASASACPAEYHQPTDVRSWRAMLDFFDEVF